MQQNHPNIPDCDGETSTMDGASEQQLIEAHRILAEVWKLLDEYAPVWYSEDLRDQLQATLRPGIYRWLPCSGGVKAPSSAT